MNFESEYKVFVIGNAHEFSLKYENNKSLKRFKIL